MLVLTSKKFEFEETVKAENELGETLYEFVMQITSDELKQINEIIFNKEVIEKSKQLGKFDEFSDEYEKLEKEIELISLDNQVKFEDICFKEHKEPLKETIGEYKYLEIVEMVFNFFWSAFIEKKTKQVNTMTSDLRKIGSN